MSMFAPPAVPALTSPLDPKVEARIAALPTNDRMKQALRLVASGWVYRDAAKEAGYASQKDLYGWAKRAGLTEDPHRPPRGFPAACGAPLDPGA